MSQVELSLAGPGGLMIRKFMLIPHKMAECETTFGVLVPRPPDLRHKRIAGLNRGRESRSVLLDIRGVAVAEQLQQSMARRVPGIQSVHDRATEAHSLTRLRRGVRRVIVAIESIQVRGLRADRVDILRIGLLALRRREILSLWSLRSTPVPLADEESAPNRAGVKLACLLVDEVELGLHYSA